MPLTPEWVLFYQGEGERDGAFSAELFADLERPSSTLYKLLRIQFPPVTETLTFSPTSTELDSPDTEAVPAAAKHLNIDDPPDSPDNDTTYVRNDTANTATEDRYGFDNLPDDVVSIEAVRVFVRAATGFEVGVVEDDGPWSFGPFVNGTTYYPDNAAPPRYYNLTHRTVRQDFPVSPDTGEKWTVAEFDALQVSLFTQPDGFGSFAGQRHTQLWVEVDVTRSQRGLYSDSPVNSRSEGVYLNRVLEWGAHQVQRRGLRSRARFDVGSYRGPRQSARRNLRGQRRARRSRLRC